VLLGGKKGSQRVTFSIISRGLAEEMVQAILRVNWFLLRTARLWRRYANKIEQAKTRFM
jgi:hypothetical protein